jgi:hypothetical protein
MTSAQVPFLLGEAKRRRGRIVTGVQLGPCRRTRHHHLTQPLLRLRLLLLSPRRPLRLQLLLLRKPTPSPRTEQTYPTCFVGVVQG